MDRRVKFSLITLGQGSGPADLLFFAQGIEDLRDPERHFSLSPDDFALLNPNTRTCPTFRTKRDASINLAIYRRAGVLWREGVESGDPWGLRFLRMFDMANDSGLFRTRAELEASGGHLVGNRFHTPDSEYVPLVEAKMIHQFNHRFGDYADKREGSEDTQLPDIPPERLADPGYQPLPRYWVPANEVGGKLVKYNRDGNVVWRWDRGWLMGWRDICRSTDERTVIAAVLPRVAVGHTAPLLFPGAKPDSVAALVAGLSSLALDYAARQKVGGTHLTYGYLKQLPLFPPAAYDPPTPWAAAAPLLDWILPRVLELTYTAWDLAPFARDVGYDGPPFRWDAERRFLLRCELDAAFFHLYGLSRDDTDYIMNTFPIVRRNDEREHGEYRTKRVILEIYDEMALAVRTGRPYATRLDPPPADPAVAHPPREVTA